MLINMYDSRWYELTNGIQKYIFECSDGLARAKITLTFECKSISSYTLIAESASHV